MQVAYTEVIKTAADPPKTGCLLSFLSAFERKSTERQVKLQMYLESSNF